MNDDHENDEGVRRSAGPNRGPLGAVIAVAPEVGLAMSRASTAVARATWILAAVGGCSPPSAVLASDAGVATVTRGSSPVLPALSSAGQAPSSSAAPPARMAGRVTGVVTLVGTPPVMRVPKERGREAGCEPKDVVSNAVIVRDGKLRDVLVRLAGEIDFPPDRVSAVAINPTLTGDHCGYEPRIQGAMVDARGKAKTVLQLRNRDAVRHFVHAYLDRQTMWFSDQREDSKVLGGPGIYAITCDAHPWMRAFVVTTPHPYFGVTGDDGEYALEDVPPGSYEVEAWHSYYGWKRQSSVLVKPVGAARADLSYETSDPVPAENRGERSW